MAKENPNLKRNPRRVKTKTARQMKSSNTDDNLKLIVETDDARGSLPVFAIMYWYVSANP